MILPLIAFFTLATLLCAVVGADSQGGTRPGPRESRHGFPPGLELPPDVRVGSSDTSPGPPRGR